MTLDEHYDDRTSFPLALAGSLAATAVAASILCGVRLHGGHSQTGIAAIATTHVAIAALVHSLAVTAMRGVFRDHVQAQVERLIWAVWIPVAWIPLLAVLTAKGSAWVLAVLPMTALVATALLRVERRKAETAWVEREGTPQLFTRADEPALLLALTPALLTAAALHAGLASVGNGHAWLAGLLFAFSCVLPVWRLLERYRGWVRRRTAAATSLTVILLTWAALLPVLLQAYAQGDIATLSRAHRGAAIAPSSARIGGLGYSGVILLLPPKPPQPLVAPPPKDVVPTTGRQKEPLLIPFDGEYWYFKAPDARPGRDARVVHGDPLKAHIHSTDPLPLMMEAHQVMLTPIAMSYCRTLKLNMVNADTRVGSIGVELLLTDRSAKAAGSVSLGREVLPSSALQKIPGDRSPVHETLEFAVPRTLRGRHIDEITVRLIPERIRSQAGAEVSVESFAMVP